MLPYGIKKMKNNPTYPKAFMKHENMLDMISQTMYIVNNRIANRLIKVSDNPIIFNDAYIQGANQLFLLRDNLNDEYDSTLTHINKYWSGLHDLYMDDENPQAEH